jgi:hypothetical protein
MRIKDFINNESIKKVVEHFDDLEFINGKFYTKCNLNKFNKWGLDFGHYEVNLYFYYEFENIKIYHKNFLVGFPHRKRIKKVVELTTLRENLKDYDETLVNESFLEIKRLEIETPEIEKILGHGRYFKHSNCIEIQDSNIKLDVLFKLTKYLKIRFENIKISTINNHIIIGW